MANLSAPGLYGGPPRRSRSAKHGDRIMVKKKPINKGEMLVISLAFKAARAILAKIKNRSFKIKITEID